MDVAGDAYGWLPEMPRTERLDELEKQVMSLVYVGLKERQIAERLALTAPAVRVHLQSIFDKLGVANQLELWIYIYQHGVSKALT